MSNSHKRNKKKTNNLALDYRKTQKPLLYVGVFVIKRLNAPAIKHEAIINPNRKTFIINDKEHRNSVGNLLFSSLTICVINNI